MTLDELLMEEGYLAPPRRPVFDYRDLNRTAVFLSSYRSGSHMVKLSMAKLASIAAPPEPLNLVADGGASGFTVRDYLRNGGARPSTFIEGEVPFLHFLAQFYARLPGSELVLFDVKYTQTYTFGVDPSMDHAQPMPVVLNEFARVDRPFVHLTRRDVVAQAMSWLLAQENGEWIRPIRNAGQGPAGDVPVMIQPQKVLQEVRRIRNARQNCEFVLTALGVRVLEIVYEDFLGPDAREEYRRVLRFLGRYADIPQGFQPPTLRQDSSARIVNRDDIRAYVAAREPDLVTQ